MELFLIRHGQSAANLIAQDIPDAPLTELGHRQAARVAARLADAGITHILSSALQRALASAQPLARTLGLPITVWKNTYEVRREDSASGLPLRELNERFPEARFGPDLEPNGWFYPGNETSDAARSRAGDVVAALRRAYAPADRVAMFSHGTFMRYLLLVLLGIQDTPGVRFRHENTCIHRLTLEDELVWVNGLGDIQHLAGLEEAVSATPA